MNRALLLLDIDHTLLDDAGELSPANADAVRQAARCGVSVVLATARSHCGAREIHAALRLDTPMIVGNGTYVVEPDGGVLHRTPVGRDRLASLLARIAPDAGFVALRTAEAVHVDHRAEALERTPYASEPRRSWRPDDPATHPDGDAVLRVAVWGPGAPELHRSGAWGELGLRSAFYPSRRPEGRPAVAVACRSASKGAAARWLRRRMELEAAPVFAVGDAPDDVSMFSLGVGAAPADADPEVRAAADHTVAGSNHSAVADALRRLGLTGAADREIVGGAA